MELTRLFGPEIRGTIVIPHKRFAVLSYLDALILMRDGSRGLSFPVVADIITEMNFAVHRHVSKSMTRYVCFCAFLELSTGLGIVFD